MSGVTSVTLSSHRVSSAKGWQNLVQLGRSWFFSLVNCGIVGEDKGRFCAHDNPNTYFPSMLINMLGNRQMIQWLNDPIPAVTAWYDESPLRRQPKTNGRPEKQIRDEEKPIGDWKRPIKRQTNQPETENNRKRLQAGHLPQCIPHFVGRCVAAGVLSSVLLKQNMPVSQRFLYPWPQGPSHVKKDYIGCFL